MARKQFSQKEFDVIGYYAVGVSHEALMNAAAQPRYNRPVSPKENWELFFSGKKPYWIPRAGFMESEINGFRPRINPDNYAAHLVFDGGATTRYSSNVVKSSWFDLEWEYVPAAGGATVHPGNPKVPDINRWESYVAIPNLDNYDWAECETANKEYLNTDKLNQLGILCGFWERLMALMDVDHAAMALIDEDQQQGVHRFFDRLCILYDDYIERMLTHCNIDSVLVHDDWGHQNGPFFSVATAEKMLLPYLKRLVESCHKRGLSFELHCCGKCELLVPCFIEAGVDLWCPQVINDQDMLAHKYKDTCLAIGMSDPEIPAGASDADIRHFAAQWVDKYKDCRVATAFVCTPRVFLDAVYEHSRVAYQDNP